MKLIRLLPILLVIGLSCLTSYFYQNIDDIEDAISRRGLDKERVLVFLSTSSTEAELFEITVNNGTCTRRY